MSDKTNKKKISLNKTKKTLNTKPNYSILIKHVNDSSDSNIKINNKNNNKISEKYKKKESIHKRLKNFKEDIYTKESSNSESYYNEDEEDCPICFEKIKFKASLERCGCLFCFGCIYRHLFDSQICPKCFKTKNSFFNLKEFKKRENKKVIPEKIFKNDIKNLKRILKMFKINPIGDLKELKWRYKELLILMEIESFKKVIKSKETIAWIIHRKEESMKNKKYKKYDEATEALRNLISKYKSLF